MAQVARPPTFAPSNFLGRPDHRHEPGLTLPAIQTGRSPASQQYENRTLPPITQLPPVQTPSAIAPASVHAPSRAIAITQLLSQSPSRDGRPQPEPLQQASYQSPPGSYGEVPRFRLATQHPSPFPHRFDTAPVLLRHIEPTYHHEAPPSRHPHSRYHSDSAEPDRPQHSPAVTTHSAPSYYDFEPSPRIAPQMSQPPPLDYNLVIRQQPAAARACGFGERDRRVIDPPPILELKITDHETGAPEADHGGLLALHCTLLSPDGQDDETESPSTHPDMPTTRRLMGTLVASPYGAKDEHGVAGTFFVFPDLSCRQPGKYRLRFQLLRIDVANMRPGTSSPSVASIVTDVFQVYTAKDFPGMRASSALLKSLRRQGLNVGVKKGSEARKGKGKTKKESSSSEDDDDDSDPSEDERRGSGSTATAEPVSPRTKPSKKKPKRKRRDS